MASQLERLPAEVRNAIFAFVYSGVEVHPHRTRQRLIWKLAGYCVWPFDVLSTEYKEDKRLEALGYCMRRLPELTKDCTLCAQKKASAKGLLQVNRTLRQEAAYFMFCGLNERQFIFNSGIGFFDHSKSLSRSHRALLKHVTVRVHPVCVQDQVKPKWMCWYGEVRPIVAARKRLPNLQSLHINFTRIKKGKYRASWNATAVSELERWLRRELEARVVQFRRALL